MSRHARSLSDVTSASLSTLATFWVALFALVGAVDLLLDTSVDMVDVRTPLMVGWLVAAVAAVTTRVLPERARTPALLGVVVALAAATVLTREATGLVAPWIQITLVAGMATMSVGLLLPYQVVPWAALAVVLLVLSPQRWDEMMRPDSPVQLGVPLVEGALIVGLGLLGALIRAVLTQSAEHADADMARANAQRRAAQAERFRQEALSAQVSLLHDTALNTLNAIALGVGTDVEATRTRCREDAARLSETGRDDPAPTSLTGALESSVARARLLGLTVTLRSDGDGSLHVPGAVVAAVAGACDEALLNVAKHSGAAEASVAVETHTDGVTVRIRDRGTGFDPSSTSEGFGIDRSIRRRMQSVGGSSTLVTAPGQGTTISLTWSDAPADEPLASTVSGTVVRLLTVFLAATTVFTSAVVVAEWESFERPAVALIGGLALGGWGLAVTWLLRRRRWIPTSVGVLTVALACTAPFWTVSSDQYCASSLGGIGWVDPRLPLVVLVILTAGRWWHALVALPAVVAAAIAAGVMWGLVFSGCGSWAISAALYAVAVLTSSLIAGRTLNRQASELWQATRERDEAEAARVRATMMRSEQQRWLAPAVATCVPLLTSIGDGTADPTCADVRRQARTESGYLRSLITVAGAPAGAREVLRDLVQRGHAAGLDVEVRGATSSLPPPPAGLRSMLASLVPADLSGADRLTITCAPIDDGGAVIITLPGAVPSDAPPVLETDEHARAPDAYGLDVHVETTDGVWAEIGWPSPPVTERVGSVVEPVGSR